MDRFTKIMLAIALATTAVYTSVVWSAVDIYNVYDNNGQVKQVIIMRSTTNPYDTGTFNTVIQPKYSGGDQNE
jgi:hypothetical protein